MEGAREKNMQRPTTITAMVSNIMLLVFLHRRVVVDKDKCVFIAGIKATCCTRVVGTKITLRNSVQQDRRPHRFEKPTFGSYAGSVLWEGASSWPLQPENKVGSDCL